MKGMEEFMYLFVIAVAVLAVLMLVFSWGPIPTDEYITIAEFSSIGTIGYVLEDPSKTVLFGSFVVGETQTEVLKYVPRVHVSTSSTSRVAETYNIDIPDYMLPVLAKVTIDFGIFDTNQYGNLIVEWNGMEFYNDLAEFTDYSLIIPAQYIERSNILEVSAAGPGALFWASTVYILSDFEVEALYGPSTLKSFQLTQAELGSLNRIRLSFSGASNSPLVVKVNDNTVYSSTPSGLVDIEFSSSTVPLGIGNNVISFNTATESGTAILNDVRLDTYLVTSLLTRTRNFNMTETQHTYLQQGTMQGVIEYNIESINSQGTLEIKLNGHVLSTPIPQEGSNTVYFSSGAAQEGDNTLSFTGTGQFDIGMVEVGLEL
jgi:hypothetical protein